MRTVNIFEAIEAVKAGKIVEHQGDDMKRLFVNSDGRGEWARIGNKTFSFLDGYVIRQTDLEKLYRVYDYLNTVTDRHFDESALIEAQVLITELISKEENK